MLGDLRIDRGIESVAGEIEGQLRFISVELYLRNGI